MAENPTSLRNIPPDAMQMVQFVSQRLGISIANILRMAIVSGSVIELIKAGPDQAGEYGGFSEQYLAELLRRHLAAPLDFLLQQGQHPYQNAFGSGGTGLPQLVPEPEQAKPSEGMFDTALMDELDELGFGGGLSDEFMLDAPPAS